LPRHTRQQRGRPQGQAPAASPGPRRVRPGLRPDLHPLSRARDEGEGQRPAAARQPGSNEAGRDEQAVTRQFPMEALQGFVALEEMANVARYLEAGRQLACAKDLQLQWGWVDAWRIYNNASRHRAAQWTYCMDIEAE